MTKVALITGASRGLGLEMARALAHRQWTLIIDARGKQPLSEAARELSLLTTVCAIPGDVADPQHRLNLMEAVSGQGRLDVLINNASTLGPSPLPPLSQYPLDALQGVYGVNVVAPLALTQLALPWLRGSAGRIINMTSDAAVEPYPGWGGYGSSKAALEQLSNVLAAEEPTLHIYWIDPGDMNTQMHQEAFPGEDISDRSPPSASVPGIMEMIFGEMPSGRFQARRVVAA
jgi:NAD(P)-dependent dehydrogenase (short-subunit alcohol dehydrogenase family)